MTDNGHSLDLIRVTLKDGNMTVSFAEVNLTLISYAMRLANLELDNQIIGAHVEKQKKLIEKTKVILPQSVMNDVLRGGKQC